MHVSWCFDEDDEELTDFLYEMAMVMAIKIRDIFTIMLKFNKDLRDELIKLPRICTKKVSDSKGKYEQLTRQSSLYPIKP